MMTMTDEEERWVSDKDKSDRVNMSTEEANDDDLNFEKRVGRCSANTDEETHFLSHRRGPIKQGRPSSCRRQKAYTLKDF